LKEWRQAISGSELAKVEDRVERGISVLKRRHGLNRCRYAGFAGMRRWVGLGVVADNVIQIGRCLALQRAWGSYARHARHEPKKKKIEQASSFSRMLATGKILKMLALRGLAGNTGARR
jgi:hypothetical protein